MSVGRVCYVTKAWQTPYTLVEMDALYLGLQNIMGKLVGWLVGCFGFNDPLRQYFSLYRAVSQREGEKVKDRGD